jgi:hypothetical protein
VIVEVGGVRTQQLEGFTARVTRKQAAGDGDDDDDASTTTKRSGGGCSLLFVVIVKKKPSPMGLVAQHDRVEIGVRAPQSRRGRVGGASTGPIGRFARAGGG